MLPLLGLLSWPVKCMGIDGNVFIRRRGERKEEGEGKDKDFYSE